jgi:Fe-S cluster biosynthesis and repair protein YggX
MTVLTGRRRAVGEACYSPVHPDPATEAGPLIRFIHEVSMARTVNCIKLGQEAEGLDFPPYPGELGKRLWESVSKEAWAQWLKQQTMLVNENRLNLADQRAREYLKRQMEKHFFGEGADKAAGYVPPSA